MKTLKQKLREKIREEVTSIYLGGKTDFYTMKDEENYINKRAEGLIDIIEKYLGVIE